MTQRLKLTQKNGRACTVFVDKIHLLTENESVTAVWFSINDRIEVIEPIDDINKMIDNYISNDADSIIRAMGMMSL